MQIAVVSEARGADPSGFAFRVEAVHRAMVDDFMLAWRGKLPGDDQSVWPCVAYTAAPPAAPGLYHPIFEMRNLGTSDALGWHDSVLGYVYGRSLVPADPLDASTLDHEAKEMRGDPPANIWVPGPDGLQWAFEMSDAVEADNYLKDVTIAGETRRVWLSNFVYPSWFDMNGKPPFDHLRRLTMPFQLSPGGYVLKRDARTGQVLAHHAAPRGTPMGELARKLFARRLSDPMSRTARRMARSLGGG